MRNLQRMAKAIFLALTSASTSPYMIFFSSKKEACTFNVCYTQHLRQHGLLFPLNYH